MIFKSKFFFICILLKGLYASDFEKFYCRDFFLKYFSCKKSCHNFYGSF